MAPVMDFQINVSEIWHTITEILWALCNVLLCQMNWLRLVITSARFFRYVSVQLLVCFHCSSDINTAAQISKPLECLGFMLYIDHKQDLLLFGVILVSVYFGHLNSSIEEFQSWGKFACLRSWFIKVVFACFYFSEILPTEQRSLLNEQEFICK